MEGDNYLAIAGRSRRRIREVGWNGLSAGLAGEAIPISGRIMAVADIYDALSAGAATRSLSRTNAR